MLKIIRWFGFSAAVLTLGLLLSGCGSSDGGELESSDAANNDTGQSADTQEDTAQEGTLQGGTGKGMIEVGDLRYELTVTRCTPMMGTISGVAESVTEPDNVEVYFELPPNDWSDSESIEALDHAGMIKLSIENPYTRWATGHSDIAVMNLPSGLDAAGIVLTERDVAEDLQNMQGKGTFVEVFGTTDEHRIGTFTFSCPPAG